ncbi:MAG: hypothetical protein LUH51_03740 [Firmicutes bacterium]|nr:hypothetical protein [Bacillota bacterium]
MTYEMYRYVFLGAAIACGIFLLLSIALFFVLRIPAAISDLSGRTARKAIENIRLKNEQSGDKRFQSSAINIKRGKLTDKISKSGRLLTRAEMPLEAGIVTEKISTRKLYVQLDAETAVLADSGETALLDAGAGITTLLDYAGYPPAPAFAVEREITFIHTAEEIE